MNHHEHESRTNYLQVLQSDFAKTVHEVIRELDRIVDEIAEKKMDSTKRLLFRYASVIVIVWILWRSFQ